MIIYINGKQIEMLSNRNLLAYLPEHNDEQPFAVALNGEFIPRSRYADICLQDGDEVDVVSPVGGG